MNARARAAFALVLFFGVSPARAGTAPADPDPAGREAKALMHGLTPEHPLRLVGSDVTVTTTYSLGTYVATIVAREAPHPPLRTSILSGGIFPMAVPLRRANAAESVRITVRGRTVFSGSFDAKTAGDLGTSRYGSGLGIDASDGMRRVLIVDPDREVRYVEAERAFRAVARPHDEPFVDAYHRVEVTFHRTRESSWGPFEVAIDERGSTRCSTRSPRRSSRTNTPWVPAIPDARDSKRCP